ncbi:hypothetical protein COOONC_00106 [Cooperia oncophora]
MAALQECGYWLFNHSAQRSGLLNTPNDLIFAWQESRCWFSGIQPSVPVPQIGVPLSFQLPLFFLQRVLFVQSSMRREAVKLMKLSREGNGLQEDTLQMQEGRGRRKRAKPSETKPGEPTHRHWRNYGATPNSHTKIAWRSRANRSRANRPTVTGETMEQHPIHIRKGIAGQSRANRPTVTGETMEQHPIRIRKSPGEAERTEAGRTDPPSLEKLWGNTQFAHEIATRSRANRPTVTGETMGQHPIRIRTRTGEREAGEPTHRHMEKLWGNHPVSQYGRGLAGQSRRTEAGERATDADFKNNYGENYGATPKFAYESPGEAERTEVRANRSTRSRAKTKAGEPIHRSLENYASISHSHSQIRKSPGEAERTEAGRTDPPSAGRKLWSKHPFAIRKSPGRSRANEAGANRPAVTGRNYGATPSATSEGDCRVKAGRNPKPGRTESPSAGGTMREKRTQFAYGRGLPRKAGREREAGRTESPSAGETMEGNPVRIRKGIAGKAGEPKRAKTDHRASGESYGGNNPFAYRNRHAKPGNRSRASRPPSLEKLGGKHASFAVRKGIAGQTGEPKPGRTD